MIVNVPPISTKQTAISHHHPWNTTYAIENPGPDLGSDNWISNNNTDITNYKNIHRFASPYKSCLHNKMDIDFLSNNKV